jgi:predicted Ser/Thr protein kinase
MNSIIELNKKKFTLIELFDSGRSSEIYLLKDFSGKFLKLKKEKQKSTRINMVSKEVIHLKKANLIGIGPKLIDFNEKEKWILMEFIKGKTLAEFIEEKPSKKDLNKVIKLLFEQAKKLDEINLDHGQLAGKAKNILIQKNLVPVIIDFEKASQKRKPHNLNVLKAMFFFNKHGLIYEKIKEILNEKEIKELFN